MPTPYPALSVLVCWLAGVTLPMYLTETLWHKLLTTAWILGILLWILRGRLRQVLPLVLAISLWSGSAYLSYWRNTNHLAVQDEAFSGLGVVQTTGQEVSTTWQATPVETIYHDHTALFNMLHKIGSTYRPGDLLEITGRIRPPPLQPPGFVRYLERQRLQGSITVTKITHKGTRLTLGLFLTRAGARAQQSLLEIFPGEPGQLLAGLLLGAKQTLSPELVTALRTTGTSHLVAISGANVVVVLAMLLRVLPCYSLRARWLYTLCIATLICIMSGASASVVRGVVTVVLLATLQWLGRNPHKGMLFLLPAAVMTAANPLLPSSDVGFQLSFAAIGGILFLEPYVSRGLQIIRLNRFTPVFIQKALGETLAATLATAPVSYTVFGTTSWLGLLVNPLLLWLVPPITFLGLALLFFGWIHPVQVIVSLVLGPLLRIFLWCIRWCALRFGGVVT